MYNLLMYQHDQGYWGEQDLVLLNTVMIIIIECFTANKCNIAREITLTGLTNYLDHHKSLEITMYNWMYVGYKSYSQVWRLSNTPHFSVNDHYILFLHYNIMFLRDKLEAIYMLFQEKIQFQNIRNNFLFHIYTRAQSL